MKDGVRFYRSGIFIQIKLTELTDRGRPTDNDNRLSCVLASSTGRDRWLETETVGFNAIQGDVWSRDCHGQGRRLVIRDIGRNLRTGGLTIRSTSKEDQ